MIRAGTSVRAAAGLAVLLVGYLAVDLLAAVPASPLRPPSVQGTAPASWADATARAIGLGRLGRPTLIVASLAVIVALLAAFAAVVAEAWRGRLAPGAAAVAAAVALALAAFGPLLLSRDVYSYAAYGRMLALHGVSPYASSPGAFPGDPFTAVVSAQWIGTPSVYGPAFTLLSAAIARVWWASPAATVLAFKVVAALAVGAAAWSAAAAARLLGEEGRSRGPLAIVLVALNPVIVVHTVGGAHNDALVAAALAGAMVLALRAERAAPAEATERGAPASAGSSGPAGPAMWAATGATVALTLAVMVKIVAGIALALWLWRLSRGARGRRRSGMLGLQVGAAVATALAVTLPVAGGRHAFAAIAGLSDREGWASGVRLVARAVEAIAGTAPGTGPASALEHVVVVVFLGLFVWGLWYLRDRPIPAAWGGGMLLFALAAPYLLPWYAAWFVPFLALAVDAPIAVAGLVLCGLLALTGVPAEPAGNAGPYGDMLLAVHYAIAPLALVLLGMVLAATGALSSGARR